MGELKKAYQAGIRAALSAQCRYCAEGHPVRRNKIGKLIHVRPEGCGQPCAARKIREGLKMEEATWRV